MVWQEGVTQIIMLTNLKEGGKVGRWSLRVAVFTINMHDLGMGEKVSGYQSFWCWLLLMLPLSCFCAVVYFSMFFGTFSPSIQGNPVATDRRLPVAECAEMLEFVRRCFQFVLTESVG